MGLFDLFTSPMNDIERGRWAITFFHNQSALYSGYRETLESLISKVGGSRPEYFLEGLGNAISAIDMRDSQVSDAMVGLANQFKGSIPTNSQVFFKALSDRVQNISASDVLYASPEIAKGIATDVAHGAKEIGDAVIDTGKSLLVIGPLLIVAAIVFIGYSKTREIAGR